MSMRKLNSSGLFIDPSLAELVFVSQGEKSHFFGYYGVSPWNADNSKLLAHRTTASGHYIGEDEAVDVGYFDNITGAFVKIDETTACNWQQGAMLLWLPGYKNKVIFNRREKGAFTASILDLSDGSRSDVGRPIHAVAPDGKLGLGLSPERLFFTRRAYSYEGKYPARWNEHLLDDGIFLIDLESGESSLAFAVAKIAEQRPHPTMTGARHWLDHPLFSPDGKRVLFYHRWLTPAGSFFTRLYTANLDGTELASYPDSGMYSHAAWLDSQQFVVFARPVGSDARTVREKGLKEKAIAMLLPVYRCFRNFPLVLRWRQRFLKDRYFVFSVGGNEKGRVLTDKLMEDGHPSFSPVNPDLMITDTYPDSKGFQKLLLVNHRLDEVSLIASFRAPVGYDSSTPNRCDLHPRWDSTGRHVCVDAMTEAGNRQVHVFRLQEGILGADA